jgi:hypothetical protein
MPETVDGFFAEVIVVWLLFSVFVGVWAHQKGRSFLVTFFGAVMVSPLLMAIAVALTPADKNALEKKQVNSGEMKPCPKCAELVKGAAQVCRFCGHEFPANTREEALKSLRG